MINNYRVTLIIFKKKSIFFFDMAMHLSLICVTSYVYQSQLLLVKFVLSFRSFPLFHYQRINFSSIRKVTIQHLTNNALIILKHIFFFIQAILHTYSDLQNITDGVFIMYTSSHRKISVYHTWTSKNQ